ncbi:MAG: Crp/Fnr family transcriptional regulator [Bacteroidetes bacterium]|nr:Crp/Fnr family transcriptional regulator [Bacteroidota bacterium]
MDYDILKMAINDIVLLPEDDFCLLSTQLVRKELKRREPLLMQGNVCRSFFFVESGYLCTWYNKDGIRINQSFTFEGGFTSVIKSLRGHTPSELTIEAGEKSIVWIIKLDALSDKVLSHPLLARFVKKVALRLLLSAESHNNLLKLHAPSDRYLYIVQNEPELLQRISLSQIASYLGIARETLSRIRTKIA